LPKSTAMGWDIRRRKQSINGWELGRALDAVSFSQDPVASIWQPLKSRNAWWPAGFKQAQGPWAFTSPQIGVLGQQTDNRQSRAQLMLKPAHMLPGAAESSGTTHGTKQQVCRGAEGFRRAAGSPGPGRIAPFAVVGRQSEAVSPPALALS